MAKPSESKTGNRAAKLLREERVYADVFPLVKLYQSFWLVIPVWYAGMGLFSLVFTRSSGPVMHITAASILALLNLGIYLAICLWIGDSVCRMSRWVGYALVLFSVSGILMTALALVFALVVGRAVREEAPPDLYRLLQNTSLLFAFPFAYFCLVALRAGRRLAYSGIEVKRIVAELDPCSRLRSPWFSKVLGMPVPMEDMRKNRALSLILFLLSSVAFSTFATTAFFAFTLAPSLQQMASFAPFRSLATVFEAGPGTARGINAEFALMRFFPWILGGVALAALAAGVSARGRGRRLMISSIQETQEHDPRRPILFLRSFYDDQVRLKTPRVALLGRLINVFQARASLDSILLEEGTLYGPVVAVGKPGDAIPPWGAARGYFADEDWQKAVSRLASESCCIVICLDQTEGVLWELDHIITHGHAPKTLFVLNPSARDAEKNKAIVLKAIAPLQDAEAVPGGWTESWPPEHPILGFFYNASGRLELGMSREFSEASYLLMVRWFLRAVAVPGTAAVAERERKGQVTAGAPV